MKTKTAFVMLPEYAALVMPNIPTPCQTCKYCYIGAFEPESPWKVPVSIAYRNGDLGIGAGCTYGYGDEVQPFDELDEILSGDLCAVREEGELIFYLPRWIQRREVERERGAET